MKNQGTISSTKGDTKPSIPFRITAEKKGDRAEIRITGVIGWETDCETFRQQVDTLVADGLADAHIYINSGGGSCFDASEIVNIIGRFKGRVTGEGGALVASAATYIALHCKEFSMPANGQFMLHKPTGCVIGTVSEMENYLKGLRNVESLYYDTYKSVASDIVALDAHWRAGDWWLTAAEAKDMGFITSVKPRIKIDKDTEALATACGCPVALVADKKALDKSKTHKKMELIALALGLKADATEAEITAKLNELQGKAARVDELEKTIKGIREAQVVALVDAAVGKKITADKRQHFIDLGHNAGVEVLRTTLEAFPEAVKPMQVIISKSGGGSTDKKFNELPEAELKELRENNREEYIRLFKAHYGFDPVF
ncbi:MAG: ATP-dependent Clp protease proteolytic subunit [Prevotellaceae bacterium]|nr:ATP-dependent Clp protease proteolytic subunit [Prevotellaceae bacterium]